METVLVVDDNADILSMVARTLEYEGFKVHCATSGRRAFALLHAEQAKIDLVVTDLQMPDGDGFELAQLIMAWRADLPVVIMTADPQYWYDLRVPAPACELVVKNATFQADLRSAISRSINALASNASL